MDKNMDWIYRPINEPDLESILAEVEKPWASNCLCGRKHLLPRAYFGSTEPQRRRYYGNCWRWMHGRWTTPQDPAATRERFTGKSY